MAAKKGAPSSGKKRPSPGRKRSSAAPKTSGRNNSGRPRRKITFPVSQRFLLFAAVPLLVLSFLAGYLLREVNVKPTVSANVAQKKTVEKKPRVIPEKQEVKTPEPPPRPAATAPAKPVAPAPDEPAYAYVPETPMEKPKVPLPEVPEILPRLKRVCLILDDFGYNFTPEIRRVLDLNPHINVAILPGRSYSRKVMDYAVKSGHEVIIHAPLEGSDGYTEPRYIRRGASYEEISTLLSLWFKEIPAAVGINNHQGSIASADHQTMGNIVEYLEKHDKIFVDSLTTPKSEGHRVAHERGLPSAKRTAPFLDNEDNRRSIMGFIEQWLAQAVGRDHLIPVAIGHITKAGTRSVLLEIVPKLEEMGYVLVPVSEAVSPPRRGKKPQGQSKDLALLSPLAPHRRHVPLL